MCGIVAYTGARDAQPLMLDALARLEYRGYDSAGLALIENGHIRIDKKTGRISELSKTLRQRQSKSCTGISHTRWATHGEPSDRNAHPHLDQSGKLALVHNGVVENYLALKKNLVAEGHAFISETDTEVLAHLIGTHYEESSGTGDERLIEAVRQALSEIEGTYGIAVVHADHPHLIVGARRGSPLVIGVGENEQYLASDATALLPYTQKVVYLKDYDLVAIHPEKFVVTTLDAADSPFEIKELDYAPEAAERGDFPHFMLKEIYEQPLAVENAMRGRINHEELSAKLGGLNLTNEQLRDIERVMVVACGTALHAGMVGEHMLESVANIPCECHFSSEFRYGNVPVVRQSIFFAVSQSGETADTLGALREARRKGYRVLGICNNVGSTIAREADGGVYMHAGPEIGVAATKSFVSQVTIFALLTLALGRMRYISPSRGQEIIEALEKLPAQIYAILHRNDEIREIAAKYCGSRSMLFFGRQANYPVALEAALKMKEISYIHAEGYPTAELKHGIIALIDDKTPSVLLCPQDSLYDKNMSSMQEIKARKGPVIAVASEGDHEIYGLADDVIEVPKTIEMLQPLLNVIPMQLLSYHTALLLGRDVDKPRNLAKSVTVE